ncbi:unnamed protein product [Adineta ricciae]|uniref:Nuclear receptor domain-containing protein n=1 Tax=Adineta ricciae TaxID=249248 RepID=A0A814NIY7_ADIRI|nr:unnamed protein product [Adineta ricciae]
MNCVSKSKFKKSLSKSKDFAYQCLVCTAPTMGFHFGVICCPPCKMFFKRNAESKQIPLACTFANRCDIDTASRRRCRFCRLNKCFAIGMKVELFHAPHAKNHQWKQLNSINLLESYQTTLTAEECNLLSHVDDLFDENAQLATVLKLFGD